MTEATMERAFYTVAISFFALSLLVFFTSWAAEAVTPSAVAAYSDYFSLTTIYTVEALFVQVLVALACLPFLKITRAKLTVVESLILSLPCVYIYVGSICLGAGWRMLVPVVTLPIVIGSVYFVTRDIWQLPTVGVGISSYSPFRRHFLAFLIAAAFSLLSLLVFSKLSNGNSILIPSIVSLFVTLTVACLARLTGNGLLFGAALLLFANNVYVYWAAWPRIKPLVSELMFCN